MGDAVALVRRILGFLYEDYARIFVLAFDDIWSNPFIDATIDVLPSPDEKFVSRLIYASVRDCVVFFERLVEASLE